MNVLIDCSNLKVGGGIQVATSFLNDLYDLDLQKDNLIGDLYFFIVLSPQMSNKLDKTVFSDKFHFIDLPDDIFKSKIKTSLHLIKIEKKYSIDKVFCVFGPSYYKSIVPKIVGYAIPHFIYLDSPYFKTLNIKSKLMNYLNKRVKPVLFKKNSDYLVFETEDARNRFCKLYGYDVNNTQVVSNTLNRIFLTPNKWVYKEFNFKSKNNILVLSANYSHKNLSIIPKVVDVLIQKLKFTDFKFVISQKKEVLKFEDEYDEYIEYLGYVSLDELPALYQSVNLLFLPTLLECFSTTYLEAMFMKVPIVTTDLSFARNICSDAAIYFSPTSESSAAHCIHKVLINGNLKQMLIKKGLKNLERFPDSMSRTKDYIRIIRL